MKACSCENTHRIRQNDRPFGRGQIIRYTDESGRVLVGGTDPRGDGCIMGIKIQRRNTVKIHFLLYIFQRFVVYYSRCPSKTIRRGYVL